MSQKLKLAFDIGGVISKYPDIFRKLISALWSSGIEIFIITDMHDKAEVLKQIKANGFGMISDDNIKVADYAKYGEFCKAALLKELQIDMFFDDFVGYCNWDSSFGPAPIRFLCMPDAFKPYWDETWKCEGGDFGRRKFTQISE